MKYGRAAKIIAIYLKTSVILLNKGKGGKSNVIHPPIDSILLNKLAEFDGLENFKRIRWTNLLESEYWNLVSRIKETAKKFDWTLEVYWQP